VFVAAEAGAASRLRIKTAANRLGVPEDLPFALITEPPDLGNGPGDTAALVAAIQTQKEALGLHVGVIILDTVAKVTPGMEENSARDMGTFLSNAEHIARTFNGLVIAIHHPGKNEAAGMRGSSALSAGVDATIYLGNEGGLRTGTVEKQKDGEADLSFTFRLEKVEVGLDEDGDPVSTCVVEDLTSLTPLISGSTKSKKMKQPPQGLRLLLDVLATTVLDSGIEIHPYPDGPKVIGVSKDVFRSAYYERRIDDTLEAKQKAFSRDLDKATIERHIATGMVHGRDFVWII
jgi:hypothetical protein